MRTKIFGLVAIVCIAFAASFIANNVSKSSFALSMVAAANVEALAQQREKNRNVETDEQFTARTGCVAVQENVTCLSSDGNRYSFAKK